MSARHDEPLALAALADERTAPVAIVLAWGPVVAWMAVIVFLSGDRFADANTASWLAGMPLVGAFGISPEMIAAANLIVRKCAHFVEYAVLGLLSLRAARATWPALHARQLLAIAVGLAALCATFDELRQFTETSLRTGSPRDVALDVTGALTAAVLALRRLSARRQPRT